MRLAYTFLVFATTMVTPVISIQGQSNSDVSPRSVRFWSMSPPRPVEIEAVLYDRQTIRSNVPFEADDKWLNHITIILRNHTSKVLAAARLQVTFADSGDGSSQKPHAGTQIMMGPLPAHILQSLSKPVDGSNPASLRVASQAVVRFKLSEFEEALKASAQQNGASFNPSAIWIDLSDFFFEDGTRWQGNHFYKPDVSRLGKYLPISQNEFEQFAPSR